MLRTLIIFSLFAYAFIRFSGKIMEFLGMKDNRKHTRRSKDGINVNYIPENEVNKQKKSFKGGEYTDFEEVE